ncbi:YhgE/Pip domain-containing protein [Lactobacillus sp. DCY120]|uniref:YhgE/Pip domain-containing protein n=1 Tax=Bombilactobacillus apium TaxID=2675299 RepID=A0A850RB64_9LACO|nr:YhgE/Pip domain-containing protein [Bombilactobacillus apium]NVY96556.1 YhgE/Pip domain-containing protein [Bombilactobacillus apium]
MIKNEWKAIGHNRLLLISVLVITLIPFLYAIFFLRSVWDPYGSTQNLPIAVVNEDRPVQYQGKTLNVGQQTVANLKQNKQLGWRFVSAETAKQGIKDKKYYTVITIPKNFSENATTVLSSKPKKMELRYQTNDSLNYIGEVISEMGVTNLEKKIRAAVTNAYASAMFSQLKVVGKGMNQAADGATQLNSGTVTLNDGLTQYTAGVSQVNKGVQTLKVKTQPLVGGLSQLQQSVQPLASGVGQLYNGSNQLTQGLQQLQGAVNASNTADKQAQIKQLQAALPQLNAGIQTLNQQVNGNKLNLSQFSSLTSQMGSVQTDLENVGSKIKDAGEKLSSLQNVAGSVQTPQLDSNQVTQQMMGGINQKLQGEQGLTPQQQAVVQGVIQAGVGKIAGQVSESQQQAQQVQGNLGNTLQGVKADLIAAGESTQSVGKSLTAVKSKANQIDLNKLNSQLTQLQTGVAQLSAGAKVALPGANQAITQLSGGLQSIQGALNGTTVPTGLVAGSQQLTGGLQQFNQSVPTLTNGINQLSAGGNQLTSGINQLATGASTLDGNSAQLLAGSQKLSKGSDQLSKSLTDGAQTVNGIKITPQNLSMFAEPTKQKHTNYSYVPNYGHALAPYVLSLALYVGAIVFNFAYPIRRVSMVGRSATEWFWSKVSIGAVVAVGMALVEATLIMVGGLKVDHLGTFYLTTIIFSLCSMFLIMFLSMLLDNPGRFLAMVLLMLQLGGSGGTFPMEITNGFFNAIHPFLPMTYSILSFRQAITSGLGTSTVVSSLSILVGITLVSLVLLFWAMQLLQRRHLMGISQLDDNQKLQALEK